MKDEIEGLERNKTWILTSLPHGKKALEYKWVYKFERKFDRSIECYKARVVILRNIQVESMDYHEAFAPTTQMVMVRTL